ncbi:hypothetical protein N2W54_002388 [Lotmaria passim]
MYRDRIRVRPAGGRPSFVARNTAYDHSLDSRPCAVEESFVPSLDHSRRSEPSFSSSPAFTEENFRDGWQYARRIATLAYSTVSSVFGAVRAWKSGQASFHGDTAGETAMPPPQPSGFVERCRHCNHDIDEDGYRRPKARVRDDRTACPVEERAVRWADAQPSGLVERRRPRSDDIDEDGYRRPKARVCDDRSAYPVERTVRWADAQPSGLVERRRPRNDDIDEDGYRRPKARVRDDRSAYPVERAVRWADAQPSGLVERRRPRNDDIDEDGYRRPKARVRDDRTACPVESPAMTPALSSLCSYVRDTPTYNITVNQYFAAPARSAYPVIAMEPFYLAPQLYAPAAYQSPSRLLTEPSAIRRYVRPSHAARAAAAEKAVTKTTRPASATATGNTSDVSLSSALSAIPPGSTENSLTVPLSVTGSAPSTGKAKTTEEPAVPLFGGKPASPAPPAFVFGAKTASTAASTKTAAATPLGSFVKPGPSAVVADDGGFAPNADGNSEKKEETTTEANKTAADSTTPAKQPTFSFKPATDLKPAFGASPSSATTTVAAAAPPSANPFSFSPMPAEKTAGSGSATTAAAAAVGAAPATTATAPASAAPKVNSFVKPGPPAVMPDDDGFAPNADKDDNSNAEPAKATKTETADPPKPLAFSFNSTGLKPAFSSSSPAAASSSVPKNPFSFTPAKPADRLPTTTTAASTATAPASAAPKVNSFVKPGPPAVMPDDSGFAPNADKDDADNDAKRVKTDCAAPATAMFSFNANASPAKTPFGTGAAPFGSSATAAPSASSPFTFSSALPASATAPPTNPFKFPVTPATGGASPSALFGTGAGSRAASSPFGSGQSLNFTFGKSN